MPASKGFVAGYQEAERLFMEDEEGFEFVINPYSPGTDEYDGFEAAVYTLTQK